MLRPCQNAGVASGNFDTLILGQGIAGSVLAWELLRNRQKILVIDDGHAHAASRVAAGLINPLAGMRFSRRAQLPDWLDAARRWYSEVADVCDGPVYHAVPMLRLFRSAEQRRFYERRRKEPDSATLLGAPFGPDDCPEPVIAPFGGFRQRETGYVDLPRLLAGLRRWLTQQGCLSEAHFGVEAIEPSGSDVRIGPFRARRLVLCDGAGLSSHSWFADLPLTRDKGELLTLQCADWHPRHIINGAHWLVPLHDRTLRFGATHDHHASTATISAEGREELLRGLAELIPDLAFKVIDHQAGFRPSTTDRYPLIGQHPRLASLWICNGFGARGTLTAPWYVGQLARHLAGGTTLPVEADIQRFEGLNR